MIEDSRNKVAEVDRTGHFEKVRKESQTKRSQRLGREGASRPTVNVGRPQTR